MSARAATRAPDGTRVAVCGECQPVVTAVSSTTKLVWSEESSTPENFSVTVVPAKADRLKGFWT